MGRARYIGCRVSPQFTRVSEAIGFTCRIWDYWEDRHIGGDDAEPLSGWHTA